MAQRSSGRVARDAQPCTRGRWPCGRCRTCQLFSCTMRWIFLWFTGATLARRTRAVIIRTPAAGSASMIVRICASTVVSTTGERGADLTGGR